MKKKIIESLYRIISFLSDFIGIQFLTKYKVLLGISLLMLASCQMIKKNDQDEGYLVSSGSDDDSFTVSCYLPIPQEEEEEGDPSDEDYVHMIVDEMPEFPGGEKEMNEYIHKRVKYPETALEKEIEGKVIVSVIIEKDGTLSEIKVLHETDPDLDKEALRIIKSMPRWKPGSHQGEAVRVQYTIMVPFRLMH